MTMLVWLLFNSLVGGILVLCTWMLQRQSKFPAHLVHTVWLFVLLRMIAPPMPEWLSSRGPEAGAPPPALIESGTPAYQREAVEWLSQTFGNNWSGDLATLLLMLWAAGCAWVLLRELRRERSLRAFVENGSIPSPDLDQRVRNIAARIGLHRQLPEVRVLRDIDSPFLWSPITSLGRRTICVVPRNIDHLPDSVLAHELVHMKRRDHWAVWAELAALAVFWWNPLAHFARRQLEVSAELACDVEVLRNYPEERHAYASALLETLERGQEDWAGAAISTARAIGWNARELTQRLERILGNHKKQRRISGMRPAIGAFLLLSLPGVAAPGLSQFARWLPSIPNELSDERATQMLNLADSKIRQNPQDGAAYNSRGRALIILGRYLEAAEVYEHQVVLGHRPGNAHYNRACALALAGRPAPAIESLTRALELGIPFEYAVQDKDLSSLRSLPEFQSMLQRARPPHSRETEPSETE